MENAVTESDILSGIYENVCILHDNTQNLFLVFVEKYETLSIYIICKFEFNNKPFSAIPCNDIIAFYYVFSDEKPIQLQIRDAQHGSTTTA